MTDRWSVRLASLAFGLVLAVPALLGFALLVIASLLGSGSLAHDIVRDLGIAAPVSVIITIVLEFHARNRLEAEIRSGVIESTIRRLIPERVWERIKIEILSQDTIRRDWTLIMNVVDDACLGDGRRYLSDTIQPYELRNLTGRETTALVQHELYSHITGVDQNGDPPPAICARHSRPPALRRRRPAAIAAQRRAKARASCSAAGGGDGRACATRGQGDRPGQ